MPFLLDGFVICTVDLCFNRLSMLKLRRPGLFWLSTKEGLHAGLASRQHLGRVTSIFLVFSFDLVRPSRLSILALIGFTE